MAYSIIGLKKLHSVADLAEAGAHNERTRDTPNADPARRSLNERLVGSGNLPADVQARLDAAGITKVRSNGIRAVEFMQTASPEWFHQASGTHVREWVERSLSFLKEEHGPNLVSAHLHMDETSPQIHAVVVPITPDGRLSHKQLFGDWDGPAKLAGIHTRYNHAVEPLGLERPTEGSKAEHKDLDRWYHEMERPTREGWALARQITIDPLPPGADLTRHVAQAVAPILIQEATKNKYWKDRAEQTERQLEGARERLREDRTRDYQRIGDIARRVRETDLTDVLTGLGAQRDPHDRHKWHVDGYELNVRGQKYADMHAPVSDKSARRGGAIDLVQYVKKWDFKTAVAYLDQRHYGGRAVDAPVPESPTYVQKDPDAFQLPPDRPESWPEVRAYLIEARRLPVELVDHAHDRGDVYATTRGPYPNAVFVRRDPDGQAVGASVRGVRGTWREMVKNSDKEKGYFSVPYGTPNRFEKPSLVLVESPIDALSYATLKATGRAYGRVVSTDGYGPLPTRMMDETLHAGGHVRAAFDNDGPDEGGARLWRDVQNRYPTQTTGAYTPIMRQMPKAKDWNEDLQRHREQEQERSGPSMMPDF